jgi:hypothetical protein
MLFDDAFNSRHSLIVGDESSGKTTLALTLGTLALTYGYKVSFVTQVQVDLPGAVIGRSLAFSEIGRPHVLITDFPPPPVAMPVWDVLNLAPIVITVLGVSRRDQVLDLIPYGLQVVSDNIWQVRCTRIVVLKSERYYPGDVFPVQLTPDRRRYVGVGQFDGAAVS